MGKQEDKKSQQWIAVPDYSKPGYFFFKNAHSKKFLDVRWGNIHNNLWQYEHNGTASQLFKVVAADNRSFFLHSAIQEEYKVSVVRDDHSPGVLIHLAVDELPRTMWTFEEVD